VEHGGHEHGAGEGHHDHHHGEGHGHGHEGPHGFTAERLLEHEEARRGWMAPEELLREMIDRDDAVLVDVGAGVGYLAIPAAARLARGSVVAVDREESLVVFTRGRAAERGLANLEVLRGEAEDLPLPDASADIVLFSTVLHDVADPAAALGQAHRVLRGGGRLLVIEFRPGAMEGGPPQELLFAPERLDAMLEAAGFAVERRWDGPGPLYRVEARPV
jgi:ubiquinone/menaquinone biosynthesis C-methylase UbiE